MCASRIRKFPSLPPMLTSILFLLPPSLPSGNACNSLKVREAEFGLHDYPPPCMHAWCISPLFFWHFHPVPCIASQQLACMTPCVLTLLNMVAATLHAHLHLVCTPPYMIPPCTCIPFCSEGEWVEDCVNHQCCHHFSYLWVDTGGEQGRGARACVCVCVTVCVYVCV